LFNHLLIHEDDMFNYDEIVCNSKFTQKHVAELTKKATNVIYPPVKLAHIVAKKKENMIVTIGRFSSEKKLEVLIEAFKDVEELMKGYKFHIIGARADDSYYNYLRRLAKGHSIVFHRSIPHKQVLEMLMRAKLYWHARGYGEDDPVEFENFGITTVEAIAAGCTPIVIDKGAQPEIVTDRRLRWQTLPELVKKTLKHPKAATIDVKRFSTERFITEMKRIIS